MEKLSALLRISRVKIVQQYRQGLELKTDRECCEGGKLKLKLIGRESVAGTLGREMDARLVAAQQKLHISMSENTPSNDLALSYCGTYPNFPTDSQPDYSNCESVGIDKSSEKAHVKDATQDVHLDSLALKTKFTQ